LTVFAGKLIVFLLLPPIYPVLSLPVSIMALIGSPRHLISMLITTGLLVIAVRIAIAFVVLAVGHYAWTVFVPPKRYADYVVWAANRPSHFLGKVSLVVVMAGLLIGIIVGMETLTFTGPVLRWFPSLGIASCVSTMAQGCLNVPHMLAQNRQLEAFLRRDR
jgi:hypothetical protein